MPNKLAFVARFYHWPTIHNFDLDQHLLCLLIKDGNFNASLQWQSGDQPVVCQRVRGANGKKGGRYFFSPSSSIDP
jgi:hypothetical protein